MIALNVWTSIIVLCKQMISECGEDVSLIDWETRSDIHELPATNLLGPATIAIEEQSSNMVQVSFAIGVSTFQDASLFRLRKLIAQVFERLRSQGTITYFDAKTSAPTSWLRIVDGTTMEPMSGAEARSFQFVSASAWLDPMEANS